MLRLWPETIHIGLFPGQCWSHRDATETTESLRLASSRDPQELLRALEIILDDPENHIRKDSRLIITVSDSLGSITTLPWQDALTGSRELQNYAKAYFARQGVVVDDDWILATDFGKFKGMGIAYILPRQFVKELVELIEKRGLRLTAILPISALIYSRFKPQLKIKEASALLLVREKLRTSALIYNAKGWCAYDVEPVTTSAQEPGLRLLSRINARFGEINSITCWTPELPEQTPAIDFIHALLPDVLLRNLTRAAWI